MLWGPILNLCQKRNLLIHSFQMRLYRKFDCYSQFQNRIPHTPKEFLFFLGLNSRGSKYQKKCEEIKFPNTNSRRQIGLFSSTGNITMLARSCNCPTLTSEYIVETEISSTWWIQCNCCKDLVHGSVGHTQLCSIIQIVQKKSFLRYMFSSSFSCPKKAKKDLISELPTFSLLSRPHKDNLVEGLQL